jgi:hypothetical protein
VVSGGRGTSASQPLCRVGLYCAVDDAGGGSSFPRSSVGCFTAAVDVSSPPLCHKSAADGRSTSMVHLGGVSSTRSCGFHQCLMPLVVVGGGSGFVLGRTVVHRRQVYFGFGVACVITKILRDLYVKWGLYCVVR